MDTRAVCHPGFAAPAAPSTPGSWRLALWPSLITLAVSALRVVGELQGWITRQSGGAAHPLGIVWLVLVFGAWFGWRFERAGHGPRVRRPWLWGLLALLALAGTIAWLARPYLDAAPTAETLARMRVGLWFIVALAITLAAAMFVVWRRLAVTLLVYGLLARAGVVAITWLAKVAGWRLHHVKFGPPGVEPEGVGETVLSACVAQFGVWVPFTVIAGTLAGGIARAFVRRA
jgi:hypothetical protein